MMCNSLDVGRTAVGLCPSCKEILFEDDLNVGVCPTCGFELYIKIEF